MKKSAFIVVILSLILSACGKSATMLSTAQIVSGIYTAVVQTSNAQAHISTRTQSPLPISTTTSAPISTQSPPVTVATFALPRPTPTQIQIPPLVQSFNAPFQVDESICDNSAYIEDITIPDGSLLAPGETFVKTWAIRNTGFCTWKDSYNVLLYDGNSMSGQETEIGKTIASGKETKISISLIAPDSEGIYKGTWIMTNEHGTPFGMSFYVQISVK